MPVTGISANRLELLSIADAVAREKNIEKEIVIEAIEEAIQKGAKELSTRLGLFPKHVVENVPAYGNTSSTTHFVALYRYLEDRRFQKGDQIMLLSFASGLEVGVIIFAMDELRDRYGRAD